MAAFTRWAELSSCDCMVFTALNIYHLALYWKLCWPLNCRDSVVYWMKLGEKDRYFCGLLSRPQFADLCDGAKPSYPLCLIRLLCEVWQLKHCLMNFCIFSLRNTHSVIEKMQHMLSFFPWCPVSCEPRLRPARHWNQTCLGLAPLSFIAAPLPHLL